MLFRENQQQKHFKKMIIRGNTPHHLQITYKVPFRLRLSNLVPYLQEYIPPEDTVSPKCRPSPHLPIPYKVPLRLRLSNLVPYLQEYIPPEDTVSPKCLLSDRYGLCGDDRPQASSCRGGYSPRQRPPLSYLSSSPAASHPPYIIIIALTGTRQMNNNNNNKYYGPGQKCLDARTFELLIAKPLRMV